MNKLLIPPVFLTLSFSIIIAAFLLFPEYNVIKFPFNLAGIIISFSGFVIMGKARDLFKKRNTTLDIKISSALIEEGIFNRTRNPMYAGMVLFLLGLAFCFKNILGFCAPILFFSLLSMYFIPKEEKLLEKKFGEDYLNYKKRVRMWL